VRQIDAVMCDQVASLSVPVLDDNGTILVRIPNNFLFEIVSEIDDDGRTELIERKIILILATDPLFAISMFCSSPYRARIAPRTCAFLVRPLQFVVHRRA
jgi:hypothetical protein